MRAPLASLTTEVGPPLESPLLMCLNETKDFQLESLTQVCSEDLMKNVAPVGGPGHIVSIDETAVGKLPRFPTEDCSTLGFWWGGSCNGVSTVV